MNLAYIVLAVLWLSLIAYAVLGGADFGGGIWDFLAIGPQAEKQRRLVGQALGPVWEANHVWLIFLLVGLFTAFPTAFSVLSTALFLPFTLALIGIVLRGSAFTFRAHAAGAVGPQGLGTNIQYRQHHYPFPVRCLRGGSGKRSDPYFGGADSDRLMDRLDDTVCSDCGSHGPCTLCRPGRYLPDNRSPGKQ